MDKLLYSRITEEIEKKITSGSFKEGEKLPSERLLAEEYDVSRNVIREALQNLSEKGFIEIIPRKGVYVITPGEEKAVEALKRVFTRNRSMRYEIWDFRAELEQIIIKKAVMYATEKNIQSLRNIYDEMEKRKDNFVKFLELDSKLHLEMSKCTNNPIFTVLLNTFYKLADSFLFTPELLTLERAATAQGHHLGLIDSIEQKNMKEAVALIKRHMDFVREQFNTDDE